MRPLFHVGALLIACTACRAEDRKSEVSLEQKMLASAPDELEILSRAVFSDDGRDVAYVAGDGKRHADNLCLVHGGKRGEIFGEVVDPRFSPDGKTLVYWAMREKKRALVCNDKVGEFTNDDYIGGVAWSRDSKHFAAGTGRGKSWAIVLDGRRLKEYDHVRNPQFSPDGATLVYLATKGEQSLIVVGDKETGPFDEIIGPEFRPDGTLVYLARSGRRWIFVVGDEGKRTKRYGAFANLQLSEDGNSYAYWAEDEDKAKALIVRGKFGEEGFGTECERHQDMGDHAMSADGSKVAYCAGDGGDMYLMVEKEKGPAYEQVLWPTFSADGSRVAYVAGRSSEYVVLAGDAKSEKCTRIDTRPRFVADGKKVVFGAHKGHELWWMVLDVK